MKGFINNINFYELKAMKYYAPPASWSQEKKEQTETKKVVIPKPEIKLPDPKLFEFDPDFFKGVENIEKFTDGGIEYEEKI